MGPLLLPAVEHELVDGLRTVHRGWQSVALLDGLDHVLVGPVPVGPLAVAHHLPHHDPEGPDVRAGGELPEGDGLRSGPPDGDLAAPGGVGAVNAAVANFSARNIFCLTKF